MTRTGIEPATFRFVAQHLNHCATAVPHYKYASIENKYGKFMLIGFVYSRFFIF